jgi:hypothetical protein
VGPGLRPACPRRRTAGQSDRGGEGGSKKAALEIEEMLRAAARLPDLLAARRAVIEESGLIPPKTNPFSARVP